MDSDIQNFRAEFLSHLHQARENCSDVTAEYDKQQFLYSKYATVYDGAIAAGKSKATQLAANKIIELFPGNKDIKILDYGCGTGRMAEYLIQHGYRDIDGLDPCKEMLDEAKRKNVMVNYFELGSQDDHSVIQARAYDVICSSGVFFASPSHPGFECFAELCRITKTGGYIIACTGNHYLESDYVDFKIIDALESEGKLKQLPKEVMQGYRQADRGTEQRDSIEAAILLYQVL